MNLKVFPVRNLGLTLLAILLLGLCFLAGQWQWDRGMDRRAENQEIEKNFNLAVTDFANVASGPERDLLWREFIITGKFLAEHEILMRNRYFEEQYGFGVATLFQLDDGRKVWIDRGWVKAGASATTPPEIVPVPTDRVQLRVRYRSDALDAKIKGSFFATGAGDSELRKWNQEAAVESESFYFDLIGGDFVPDVPTSLPALSDGPHLAYAIQWWFFGALVIFGRFLIAREDRSTQNSA